jgi:glycosyltransferase involved in cell wall biosynthesis
VKILYLTLDPPLDVARVATGNQVRAQGIREALEAAGHEVLLASPTKAETTPDSRPAGHRTYRTREEARELVREFNSDVVVVAYWALLAHLDSAGPPIVVDFIAPRLLELLYQDPEELPTHATELIGLLARADHFLVGNQRQADLLLPLLLQAGFDCRDETPISIVPIAARGRVPSHERASGDRIRVVTAGVAWPWRQDENYLEVLRDADERGDVDFVELRGRYPGEGEEETDPTTLRTYQEMQALLLDSDIGIELGARNTERIYSHSFRALEYLECGLPVVINSWIPLAELIRKYDAGWVIDAPGELESLIGEWLQDPSAIARKRQGARRLVTEELNYARASRPLLEWLENPARIPRFGAQHAAMAAGGETPGLQDFVESPSPKPSTFKVLMGALFKILLCPRRPDATPDVLMMTRSDLFPTDHGAAVKIIRSAEALSRQGRDVYLATDDRREYYRFRQGERSSERYPWWIRLMALPRVVAFSRLILKGYPVSNSFLYLPVTDGSYIVRAIWLASRKPVGAYMAEFPAYVRPLRFARSLFGGKLVLVEHNVEYERIRNQVPDLTERNFRTLKHLELAMCQLADAIITVSENDRQKLIEDGVNKEKIHTIPHGVDLKAFESATPIDLHHHHDLPRGDRILIYHGTYSYPPNLQAMQVMASEILPRLDSRGLHVSVIAVGSLPPDFPLHEKIRFVGSVADLAEVLPAADLAVVPLLDGGGTRMKILDYFAAGIPVISTTKGIEGIPVRHGREALIVDDFDCMCEEIDRILGDAEAAGALTQNASRFVESLSWDAIARRYLPLMK